MAVKKLLKRVLIACGVAVAGYYGLIYGYLAYLNHLPKEERYLIPEGYVGWIIIHYMMPQYPDIPTNEDGLKIIKIPITGEFKTSFNPTTIGRAEGRYGSEYYFYSKNGIREVPIELIDWRGNVGRVNENGKYYEFRTRLWVGTQEQYAQYGMASYENPEPGSLFPLPK